MTYKVTCFKSLVTALILMQRYIRPSKRSGKIYNKLVVRYNETMEEGYQWDDSTLVNEPDKLDSVHAYDLLEALKTFGSWKQTGVQRELQQFCMALEKRAEALFDKEYNSIANKSKKKVNKMTIKKASKIVSEFLNGPQIQTLLITKSGVLRRKQKNGSPAVAETFGCLESNMTAIAYQQDYRDFLSRGDAHLTWFGTELANFYDHLVGDGDKSKTPEEEDSDMGFFALGNLLDGVSSKSKPKASESAWSDGQWCAVCLEGETIPGIALRVNPVEFTDREIIFMAEKIESTREKARKVVEQLTGELPDLVYGKDIVVTINKDKEEEVKYMEEYDPSIVNIEPTAVELVERIVALSEKPEGERPKTVTGLFYGVPGTGKSKLVEYIGGQLGLPVLKKTYGELQSKYVGEGEKNLHKAFEEAKETGSILLIDEIDSMAGSRHKADRTHQKTFTNQLLTELDEFEGYFFATSNFMEGLDPAVLRRLFLKTEFKFLNPEQVESCFQLYFPKFKKSKLGIYDYITPGDLKVVQQAALFEPKVPNIKRIREMVQKEIDLKRSTMPEVMKSEMSNNFQL